MQSSPLTRSQSIPVRYIPPFFLLLAFLLLYLSAPASAQHRTGLEVSIGLDGQYQADTWTPFRIRLKSELARMAPLDIELAILTRDPMRGRKTLRRYYAALQQYDGKGDAEIIIPAFLTGRSNLVQVTVLKDGMRLAQKIMPLDRMGGRWELLVLTLTTHPEKFNIISSMKMDRNVKTAFLPPEKLGADWTFYQGASCVMVDDLELGSLTEEQFEALRSWLCQGGNVIFTAAGLEGNAEDERFKLLTGFGVGDRKRIVSPVTLTSFFDEEEGFVEYTDAVEVATDIRNVTLMAQEVPLILRRETGLGVVHAITFRPEELSLKDPSKLDPFARKIWTSILADCKSRAGDLAWKPGIAVVPEAATENLLAPSAVYLLALVLVLGPINFILLRKLDKREFILLTVPIVTILLGVGAFATGFALRGNEVVKVAKSVIIGKAGDPVFGHRRYVGILSPRKTLFGVSAFDNTHPEPHVIEPSMFAGWQEAGAVGRFPVEIRQRDRRIDVSDIEIPMWGMEFLQFVTAEEYAKSIDYALRLEGNALVGHVVNRLPFPLKECFVVYRHNKAKLGDLKPDETKGFVLEVSPPPDFEELRLPEYEKRMAKWKFFQDVNWENSGVDKSRLELLAHTLETYRDHFDYPVVTGWADSPSNLRVVSEGTEWREIASNLMVFKLTLYLYGNQIEVPLGLSRRYCTEGYGCSPYADSVDTGIPLIVALDLPFNAHRTFEIDELVVHLRRSDRKESEKLPADRKRELAISLFDWNEQEWTELLRTAEQEIHYKVETDRAKYVRFPEGLIRIKAEIPDSDTGSFYPSVEGEEEFGDVMDYDSYQRYRSIPITYFDVSLKGHFPES